MTLFLLPIGDWSKDGHSRSDWFVVDSPQDVQAWRDAYFEGVAKWPDLAPDRLEGDVWGWPQERLDRARDVLGVDVGAALERYTGPTQKGSVLSRRAKSKAAPQEHSPHARGPTRVWAEYTLAFCKAARPTLEGSILELPMLPFYGRDKWDRHISAIGYDQW